MKALKDLNFITMSDELQIIDKVLYGVDHFNKRKKQNKSSDFSIFTIKLWKTKRE